MCGEGRKRRFQTACDGADKRTNKREITCFIYKCKAFMMEKTSLILHLWFCNCMVSEKKEKKKARKKTESHQMGHIAAVIINILKNNNLNRMFTQQCIRYNIFLSKTLKKKRYLNKFPSLQYIAMWIGWQLPVIVQHGIQAETEFFF